MEIFFIIVGIIGLIQISIWLLLFISFNHRGDNDPHLKYFTHEDFSCLTAEPISFISGKTMLRGFIYDEIDHPRNRLIIFNMGIGAGHQAYTHVIKDLVKLGYAVLAYDYTGCTLSDGRRMKGLPQALRDFQAAMVYVASREDLNRLPLFVVGHSWGGYVSGIAARLSSNIKKIIVISGFNSVPEVVASNRKILKLFGIFIDFANLIMFGKVGIYDVVGTIRHSETPTLFILGAKDPFLNVDKYVTRLQVVAASKPFIRINVLGDKNHNPYLTKEGEAYLIDTLRKKKTFDKQPESSESQTFYRAIDYDLITKNDPSVFSIIKGFLEEKEFEYD